MAARFLVVAGLALLSLTACGSAEVVLPSCTDGPARPLSPDQVVAGLRRHGFSAEVERKWLCGPRAVAGVTNAPPDDTSDATSERSQREGPIYCTVEKEPFPNSFLQRYEDRKKVGWSVANIDCAVYFVDGRKDDQVRRLELAMTEFSRLVSSQ